MMMKDLNFSRFTLRDSGEIHRWGFDENLISHTRWPTFLKFLFHLSHFEPFYNSNLFYYYKADSVPFGQKIT